MVNNKYMHDTSASFLPSCKAQIISLLFQFQVKTLINRRTIPRGEERKGKDFRLALRMVSVQRVMNMEQHDIHNRQFAHSLGKFQSVNKRTFKEGIMHYTPVLKVGGLKTTSLSPTEILEKLCIIEDSLKSHATSDPSSC